MRGILKGASLGMFRCLGIKDPYINELNRLDQFLHFQHLAGCGTYTANGLPCGDFGATFAQVYSKVKVPFYNYNASQDCHGKTVSPSQILKGSFKGFKVSSSIRY